MKNSVDKNEIISLVKKNLYLFPSSNEYLGAEGFVYLAGSIMEGFGNTTSDIDVFIIYQKERSCIREFLKNKKTDLVIDEKEALTWNFRIDGYRFDCEFWEYDRVLSNIRSINEIDVNSEKNIANIKIENKIIDFFHRLKFGYAICNSSNFQKTKESICFDNVNYYLAMYNTAGYSGVLEDVQGAYLSGDLYTAYFQLRQLAKFSVNAYLSIMGETNPSDKWIYRKFARYSDKVQNCMLLERYLELQTVEFNADRFPSLLEECLEYCQMLSINTQNQIKIVQKNNSSIL